MTQLAIDIPEFVSELWKLRTDTVVRIPADVLRKTAQQVGKPGRETRSLVDHMKQQMAMANGMGLAAPQVGELERVIIYRLPEENAAVSVIVNPKIVSMKGEQTGPEGCLSMPYLQGDVKRAFEVIVKGQDMLGRPLRRRATELEARVIQHEVDHLDGILFIDRAIPETLEWYLPEEAVDPEAAVTMD